MAPAIFDPDPSHDSMTLADSTGLAGMICQFLQHQHGGNNDQLIKAYWNARMQDSLLKEPK